MNGPCDDNKTHGSQMCVELAGNIPWMGFWYEVTSFKHSYDIQ